MAFLSVCVFAVRIYTKYILYDYLLTTGIIYIDFRIYNTYVFVVTNDFKTINFNSYTSSCSFLVVCHLIQKMLLLVMFFFFVLVSSRV